MINPLKKAWRWLLADEVGEEMDKTIARGAEPIIDFTDAIKAFHREEWGKSGAGETIGGYSEGNHISYSWRGDIYMVNHARGIVTLWGKGISRDQARELYDKTFASNQSLYISDYADESDKKRRIKSWSDKSGGSEPISKERINEIASDALKKANAEIAEQDKQMFDKYRDACTRKDVWTNKGGVWRQVCYECSGSGWAPRVSGLIFDGKRQLYRHIVDCLKKCPKCQGRGWVKEFLTNTNN